MAYGYYPQYQQYQQQPTDSRIWVQGEVGAKAYLCAPNNVVTLWDTERQAIYLKSVSPNGMPSLQTISYTFDAPAPAPDYITRSEFEKAMADLKGVLNGEQ